MERSVTRPTDDIERDASAKPAEVLAFVGIVSGMTVLDLNSGAGYFTELISAAVGEAGRVIAHNHPGALTLLGPDAFERRYGKGRLGNVEQLFARHDELALPPASLDAILMFTVYHDTYWYSPKVDWGPVDQHALLTALLAALKPAGVFGVVDHCAKAGADPRQSAMTAHRIDPAVVRRDFAKAGFVLDAESDVLRNPADDHARSVFDPGVRGRTDRFLMRFQRPR